MIMIIVEAKKEAVASGLVGVNEFTQTRETIGTKMTDHGWLVVGDAVYTLVP